MTRRLGRRAWHAHGASALAAAGGVLAQPSIATACAVCFGTDSQRWASAFAAGTVVIGLLPPAIIGMMGLLIYRSSKRARALRDARDGAAPKPAQRAGRGPRRAQSPAQLTLVPSSRDR